MKRQTQTIQGILKWILFSLGTVFSLLLLSNILFLKPGTSAQAGPSEAELHLMDSIHMAVTDRISGALEDVAAIKPVKRVYQLRDDDLVAPEPKPEGYRELNGSREVEDLLSSASALLEGQSCYFSATSPLKPDSKALAYLDETILAITWKEVHDDCVYTFSEVKIAHPSQFRRFLAGGEYGSGRQFYTTEMAKSVNAVVASSGDFYGYRSIGTNIYNGKVYRVDKTNLHTCMVDENGDLRFTYEKAFPDVEAAQAYVSEKGIRFGLSFGPVLIENGELRDFGRYGLGEPRDRYSRAALCQMDTCHYLLCTANYEQGYPGTPTMGQFAQVLATTGCTMAYALDGGQTASLVMDDRLINSVSYGSERKISDIIYFATAIP